MSETPITLDQLLLRLRLSLQDAGLAMAALEARMLLEAAAGLDRVRLVVEGGSPATADVVARAQGYLARRLAGEPVGRIIGSREFYGLDFELGPDTLEPRPDTETLVDVVVRRVRSGAVPGVAADGTGLRFADIGTGTGAIAVTLLTELPGAQAVATDLAPGAIEVAQRNAARHGVAERLDFRPGSYLEPLDGRFGMILSNPPYIASAVVDTLSPEVRDHDPRLALDGGADGLTAYRALTDGATALLVPRGMLVVEIGFDQGETVKALFEAADLREIEVLSDLGGLDRVVLGVRACG
ncbi:peptide chain release factor N(5)-glutamine methyltransferase [Oryzibacter oryziterrae]|uniref:peptide chain release factor N(5)-glutamine methyltransferase n=1 Tax=Oryzibacter oryziterrae TaxID=2766474 RepID=UPI001EFFC809|nr:peptide chain release factor N(5)-glutamine methyltransferase [Oryzibacter oryziterrae]